MWHTGIAAVGLSFWLAASLTTAPDALAQGAPGYRTRVRPPRLTATAPITSGSDRHVRSFFPYYWPFGGYYGGSENYQYPDDSAGESDSIGTQRVPVQPAREVSPVYDTVPPVGPLQVSSILVGNKPMVRLTWRDNGVGAKQVAFFLADSTKAVLSAQTVRSPPFTVLLEQVARTAYAGMTVMLPGGALDTQYVPYRRQPR